MQVEAATLELSSTTIVYQLKRSRRRRRTIEVSIDATSGLSVAAPMRTPQHEIDAFLRRKQEWIVLRLEGARNGTQREERSYRSGESVPYLGEQLTLRVVDAGEAARTSARLAGGCLEVRLTSGRGEDERRAAIAQGLERWYRARARVAFSQRVRLFSRLVGAEPRRVIAKAQKTRWGSCGKDGTLRFNWCLVMAPLPLVDYIVVHELCHLRRPGHGKAFWRLVAKVLPDFESRRAELRRSGWQYRFP